MTGLAGLAGMTLAACGDDSGDTKNPDAAIDSQVGSDGSGSSGPDAHVFKGYDADEGGEVRLEYITSPAGISARGAAYFYKDPGTPGYHDFINQMGTCIDTRMKGTNSQIWPLAQNADTVYADVGPEVDILGQTEAGMAPFRLPKSTSTTTADPFGRTHAGPWYYQPTTMAGTGTTYFAAGTSYDVALPGSADIPAQIFDNAIYMPENFTPNNPSFPSSITVTASGNTDQEYHWDVHNTAPAGVEVLSLIAFTGGKGPAVVCIEPNDGDMTIPGAMLDIIATEYPAPVPPATTSGTFARQTLTHQVRELYDANGPTGRRVDFIGVWCFAQSFVTTPAP